MRQKILSFNFIPNKKELHKGLKLPKNLTKELAYLCGILIGDGSIQYRKEKNEYRIKCVGNPKDEKEFYYDIISPHFNKVFGFAPTMKFHDSKTTFGFIIYSKSLFNYLTQVIKLTNGKKDKNLMIPKIFLKDKPLLISVIRGIFDTDGCICFKKKYTLVPYYPVISLSSQSKKLISQVVSVLKKEGFKVVETYDYKFKDLRAKQGFTVISRLELNGKKNMYTWLCKIGFSNPKHLKKIGKVNSGERI